MQQNDYFYKAQLARVIDGDTVELKVITDVHADIGFNDFITTTNIRTKTFRLYGINAPETRTRDESEKAKGKAAKNWLVARLTNMMTFTIKTIKDKRGSFSRYLCIIIDPETKSSINVEMISAGHAVAYKKINKR